MLGLGPLHEEARADVCVVGAGIAGLTTAYLLTRAGKNVIVLESDEIGSGETGRTTAHLAFALDDRFTELERLFGKGGARLAAESHMAAVDRIEAVVNELSLDCEFERLDGYLFAPADAAANALDAEFEAALEAGVKGIEILKSAPIPYQTGPCLRFPRQGQFHPMKYLSGLANAIRKHGGRIFVHSRVEEFEGGEVARAKTTDGGVVRADALVVATNTPINNRFTIHTKQHAYRSYAIAMSLPIKSIPRALYWDTEEPYHYVRLTRDTPLQDLLIVGGEDHKTGQDSDPGERFRRLEQWARARFPQARDVVRFWSGQIMEPVDSLAFIGRNPSDEPNVFIATGDSGHGMTHGTIAGMLLTDLILGRENPWADLYDPGRRTFRAAGEFLRENVNVAGKYLEWLGPGEVRSADGVKPGGGAVMRRGLTKVALHRDEEGNLHTLSAVCPHLGCFVHWNGVEKTWDCPCHGSRFDVEGNVLNGPALGPLTPAEEPAEAK
jgi:glycine/D-amino acid oxidase-like deaminating enzyme/nitrite reductase/ring-hydroxylating ferredoxin subunit